MTSPKAAMPPPPGVKQDFVDPPTFAPWVTGVAAATIALMTVAVAIRMYTKVFLLKKVGIEEYLAVLGLIGACVYDALCVWTVAHGMGRHLWDTEATKIPHILYLLNVIEIEYGPTMFFLKCSVLFQLKSIFCPTGRKDSVFWMIWIQVAIVTMYYISYLLISTLECLPREKIWNEAVPGTCINQEGNILGAGIANFLTDIGIFFVPLWAIWHLQMPLKQKLGAGLIFAVGAFTCIISAAGLAYRVILISAEDFTWVMSKVGLWGMAEYFGIVLVGSMPSFPRFFESFRRRKNSYAGMRSASISRPTNLASTSLSSKQKMDDEIITQSDQSDIELVAGQ